MDPKQRRASIEETRRSVAVFADVCTAHVREYREAYCGCAASDVRIPRKAILHVVDFRLASFAAHCSDLPEPVTLFHSHHVPARALEDFAVSVATGLALGADTVADALVLCCRYEAHTGLPVTALMMHRLLLAALLGAAKARGELFSAEAVMEITGIDARELRRLEFAFFKGINGRAIVLLGGDGDNATLVTEGDHPDLDLSFATDKDDEEDNENDEQQHHQQQQRTEDGMSQSSSFSAAVAERHPPSRSVPLPTYPCQQPAASCTREAARPKQ